MKKLPDYQSLVPEKPVAKQPQSPKQLERLARKLARFGTGEFLEPEK